MTNYKEILNEVNIEEELESRGIEYKYASDGRITLRCPIHNDKDYAAYINIDRSKKYFGIYKCFSCDYRSTIFEFLAEYDDVSVRDILKKFKKDISLEDIKKIKKYFIEIFLTPKEIEERKDIKIFNQKALLKFSTKYPFIVERYLIKRKIDIKFAKKFGVMVDLRKRVKKNKKVRRNYRYTDLVFPYIDCENRLRGIVWRKSKEVEKGKNKVYNLPGSQCNQILFGLKRVLENNYYKRGCLILVEGEIDCLYMQSLKYPAVSLGHKDITDSQIKEIDDYVSAGTIYLFLDGDVSEKELIKVKKKIKNKLTKEKKIIIKKIPDKNKDPNDLIAEEISLFF